MNFLSLKAPPWSFFLRSPIFSLIFPIWIILYLISIYLFIHSFIQQKFVESSLRIKQ